MPSLDKKCKLYHLKYDSAILVLLALDKRDASAAAKQKSERIPP